MVSIGCLGSHSALEICQGGAKHGIKTLVFSEIGRDKHYLYYLKTKRKLMETGIIDKLVRMNSFREIANQENIKLMQEEQCVFVPNRSFCVYVGYDTIENKFPVKIFGNRFLLRKEERNEKNNQYDIIERAGLRQPLNFKPGEIDRPVIVKVNEKERSYERAFFIALDGKDFEIKAEEMIRKGVITREALENARIEELLIGPQFNFNFFYSPIEEALELIGIDMRRQTNADGFAKLPWWLQPKTEFKTIECGHIACTLRESLLSKVFDAAEKTLEASREIVKEGIIGPFALQCMVVSEKGKEDIVIFDLSFRIPGSPGIKYTPYTEFLFLKNISMGERIATEIKNAEELDMIDSITT